MREPACIVWASLTPLSPQLRCVGISAGIELFDAILQNAAKDGDDSPGRLIHSDTTLYISLVFLYTKYTGRRQNDFNVYA